MLIARDSSQRLLAGLTQPRTVMVSMGLKATTFCTSPAAGKTGLLTSATISCKRDSRTGYQLASERFFPVSFMRRLAVVRVENTSSYRSRLKLRRWVWHVLALDGHASLLIVFERLDVGLRGFDGFWLRVRLPRANEIVVHW